MPKTIEAADLFCGAGGTSEGLLQAAQSLGRKVNLRAVNHWQRAVETHSKNHPTAIHACEDLNTMDPKKVVPSGKLDLLVASPECTHHSAARGGVPMLDQSRASAWCVLRWATALDIKRILIENVKEFQSWGPLGSNGRPLKTKKGETFKAFVYSLASLGYTVDWRVLNCADYGDPTTRERLFIQAVKGRRRPVWPAPTHAKRPGATIWGNTERWRPAREIIDWNLKGTSIFNRTRPLSENTINRIEAGLKKFGGRNAEPFLLLLRGSHRGDRSVDMPLSTVTGGGHHALVEPFTVGNGGTSGTGKPRSVNDPLKTVLAECRLGVVEPFIVPQMSGGDTRSTDDPIPTVTTTSRGIGLVEPMLLSAGGPEVAARPVSQPANTVLTRDHMALVEPFVMQTTHHGGDRCQSADEPLRTITTAKRGEHALVEPFIHVNNYPNSREHDERYSVDIDQPLPTVTAQNNRMALIDPFMVPYFGACHGADSVDEPMRTVTTKQRLGLVEPTPQIDILFRMLQPHELAAAMSFPKDYRFTGNRSEIVKQIGNAVPVRTARALCLAMLEDE